MPKAAASATTVSAPRACTVGRFAMRQRTLAVRGEREVAPNSQPVWVSASKRRCRTEAAPGSRRSVHLTLSFARVADETQSTTARGKSPTTLSLVIPAYNEQERLPALLETLRTSASEVVGGAEMELLEALIVDDGSSDASRALLREAGEHEGLVEPLFAYSCLLYTSPSPRDGLLSRMPSSA